MWHVISFSPAFFEIDIRFIPFRVFVCVCVFMCVYLRQHLSKDGESNQSYLKDPLIKQKGSLKGISDMLNRVSITYIQILMFTI